MTWDCYLHQRKSHITPKYPLPFGQLNGKSLFLVAKSTINGHVQ